MAPTRACMSVDEFAGLVAVAFFGAEAHQLDPDIFHVPDGNNSEIVQDGIQSKRSSKAAPGHSCLAPTSSSPPRSFLTTGISSPSFLSSIPQDFLDASTLSGRTSRVHARLHQPPHHDNLNTTRPHFNLIPRPRTVSSSTTTMSYEYDSPYSSALHMGSGSPNTRKPLALLSKLRRQASALVKPSNTSATQGATNSRPFHSKWNTIATTRLHPKPVPTVSFAPTPVPSVSTFPTSSSIALSRLSTSGISEGDSFLDCEDGRRSFGSLRLVRGRSMPALFRNKNLHLTSNDVGSRRLRPSQDDVRSMATSEATTTTTEDALSTESGDYIPYIPLVLQHERVVTKMGSMVSILQVAEEAALAQPIIPPIGRRTISADIYGRSTPSPTLSQSTIGSSSTQSPCTPEAAFFAHSDPTPSISINSEDEGEDMLSITSSIAPSDEYDMTSNIKGKSRHSSIILPGGYFKQPKFEQGSRSAGSVNKPRYARYTAAQEDDDDSFFNRPGPDVTSTHEQGLRSFEDDRKSIASTSESCYSTESYGKLSEMYRRSRTESLVLPDPSRADSIRLSATSTVLDKRCRSSSPYFTSPPPDIRVETASMISDLPTPTAATYSHPMNDLNFLSPNPPSPTKTSRPTQIGVGRQTIDPRVKKAGKDDEPAEWTLLLGEEETSFARVRKASESGAAAATKKAGAPRTRTRSMGTERPRKKSGVSALSFSTNKESTLPFAAEPHVQTPLLRFQQPLVFDTEDSNGYRDGRLSMQDRDRALRRSGSAHPVLGGGRKADRHSDGDQADWTLMLPLAFPKRTRKSSSNNFLSVPQSLSPRSAERKRVVTKARSSVDLTTPVTHMRTRKVSSPLLFDKNHSKAAEPRHHQHQQHKKELSAEEMLAVILESSAASIPTAKGSGEDSGISASSEMDRDDHRALTLNVLSGTSTPCGPSSRRPSVSPPLTPKVDVSELTTMPDDDDSNDRSISPTPSILRFEERLSTLMDDRVFENKYLESAIPCSKDEFRISPKHSSFNINDPFPFAPPAALPPPPRPKMKPAPVPFPMILSPNPRPSPSAPYTSSSANGTLSLPSSPPASTELFPSINPPRPQSFATGVIPQHGPANVKPGRPSLKLQPRSVSATMGSAAAGSSPFLQAESDSYPAPERLRIASHHSNLELRRPFLAKKECTPINIPIRQSQHIEIEVRGSPTRPHSSSFSSTSSSTSSTKTVVPKANIGASSSLEVIFDAQDPHSPQTPCLIEDFPLPPASLPLSGVIPQTPSPPRAKPHRSPLSIQVPPILGRASSVQDSIPTTPRMLGADEDVELPPPTPIVRSSPTRISSPAAGLLPVRASPTPDRLLNPLTTFNGVVSTSVSQWMDDEEDEDGNEGSSIGGHVSTGETDYEDAVSMFAISEEDYEDAVSMLSGVFYSARTSFDG